MYNYILPFSFLLLYYYGLGGYPKPISLCYYDAINNIRKGGSVTMAYSTYRFTLDVQRNVSQVSLSVRQRDTSRSLAINLTDGGTPYIIEDGCSAVFAARRPDGTPIDRGCIIENKTTIRYDLNGDETLEPGIVDCEIRLYDIESRLITSPRFLIVVDARVYDNDEILPEADAKSFLDEIYGSEAQRRANETARIAAEEARQSAETERDTSFGTFITNANNSLDEAIQKADSDIALMVSNANKSVADAISNANNSVAETIANANAAVSGVLANANAAVSGVLANANEALATAEATLATAEATLETANEAASKVNMEQIVQNVLDELPVWDGGSY